MNDTTVVSLDLCLFTIDTLSSTVYLREDLDEWIKENFDYSPVYIVDKYLTYIGVVAPSLKFRTDEDAAFFKLVWEQKA